MCTDVHPEQLANEPFRSFSASCRLQWRRARRLCPGACPTCEYA
jgi:hypothetical protein